MTNYKHSLIALGVISALTLSHSVTAAENDVHDADPRNTAWRGGIASDDNGEIKLVAGGGFNNLYGGDGVETQTIMIGEYFTQSEDFRFHQWRSQRSYRGYYSRKRSRGFDLTSARSAARISGARHGVGSGTYGRVKQ